MTDMEPQDHMHIQVTSGLAMKMLSLSKKRYAKVYVYIEKSTGAEIPNVF
jgi:hypothetical protein